jgi:purine nucleosidase
MPLILDVDTGVDDALALLYAAASAEVELVAATCVMGNVTVDQAVDNTLAVIELVGLDGVEVARGADRPLVRDHLRFPIVHGDRGLGDADPPPGRGRPSSRSAVEAIVSLARERPGEILLVATGPLTNVALATAEEPELPSLLKGFGLMGGAFGDAGNVSPAAEFNIWTDPEAAATVLRAWGGLRESRLPICVGLDVTERVRMSRTDVELVAAPAPDSELGLFIRDAVTFYIDFRERFGARGAAMHDPLALAVAMDPSLARLQTTRVEVETDGRWTRGETVADFAGVRHTPWRLGWEPQDNARVAVDVDERAFMKRFLARLRDLVEARA